MSIFDSVVSEEEKTEFRQAPEGPYRERVVAVKKVKNERKGTEGIELECSLQEALGEQDMEGVDLARVRPIKYTIWVTENSRTIASQTVKRIAGEVEGAVSFNDYIEMLPGCEFVGAVYQVTKDYRTGETLRIPNLRMSAVYSMDWARANADKLLNSAATQNEKAKAKDDERALAA